jgi:hypothetical protein
LSASDAVFSVGFFFVRDVGGGGGGSGGGGGIFSFAVTAKLCCGGVGDFSGRNVDNIGIRICSISISSEIL